MPRCDQHSKMQVPPPQSSCRECGRATARSCYLKRRRYYIEQSRKYALANPESNKRAVRKYQDANREEINARNRARSRLHPRDYKAVRRRHWNKIKARHSVDYALRTGKMIRQPCEECGAKKSQAHHR